MKPFTNTDAGWDRLYRVCEVIREHFGLSGLVSKFSIAKNRGNRVAACWVRNRGRSVHIVIHELFFKHDFDTQYETLVHEHLHALMGPLDQFICNHKDKLKKRDHATFDEMYEIAVELTVDYAVKPIAKLLWPHVKKVL